MTEHLTGFLDDAACVKARMGLVALRLALAVNRLRALRGDGREDRFAGVLMRDVDIATLCADLIADPLPGSETLEAQLAQARDRYRARLAASGTLPRSERLRLVLGLTEAEDEALWLMLAGRLDDRLSRVIGYLQEDLSARDPRLGLFQRLLADLPGGDLVGLWRAFGADGALVRFGLVRGPATDAASVLEPAPWLPAFLLTGDDAATDDARLPLPGLWPAEGPILVEAGSPMDALAALAGSGPVHLDLGADLSETMRRAVVAATSGEGVMLAGKDDLPETDRARIAALLGRHTVLVTERPGLWLPLRPDMTMRRADPSSLTGRKAFWDHLLTADIAAEFAAETVTDPLTLWRMARAGSDDAARQAIARAARSDPMRGLATRVDTPFTLDDLEVPGRLKHRLQGFAGRHASDETVLNEWGLGPALGARPGAVALFLGPSGVGKTMAAACVARAAGLELWRVNLAGLVSKYIGETEANLDRVFTAADKADVVLFFDEAEALFSKRGEVKDARDRYANMQMAYLLQRIEGFRGMAVLASNMGASLDPAMLRRFDLVAEFAMPDGATRRRLWGRIEAGQAPLAADVDLDLLAERFELAGGHIRQAILDAAHEGVGAGEVSQDMLLRAVAREYAKLGRPIRREDFGTVFAQVKGGA